jgi:hypothetical protein
MIAVILFCGAYAARNGWQMLQLHFEKEIQQRYEEKIGAVMLFGGGVIVGAAAWAIKGGAA